MATQFFMPQLGLTMTEGTVTKWFKAVNDSVSVGELLVEVSTDKITNQIEANASGVVLDIVVPEGSTVPVKSVLAVIGEAGEQRMNSSEAQVAVASAEPVTAPSPEAALPPKPDTDWVLASPLARKLAKDRQLDLSLVTGTGPDGRVVEQDILNHQLPNKVKASPLAAKIAQDHGIQLSDIPASGPRIMKHDVLNVLPPPVQPAGKALTGMRKIIADRMSTSWQTAPHVHLSVEIDMSAALALKDRFSQAFSEKLSPTELFVKVAARTLSEYRLLNNSLINGQLIENSEINIGIAVALDNGLIVPVIRQANQKSVLELRREIASLSDKARAGKLLPDEYSGGTFTVTNLGMFGVDHFTPVINPPESAILGIGRVAEKPVVASGTVVIRPMLTACLGFDHRLIDGALAARFMARLRQLLEEPILLL